MDSAVDHDKVLLGDPEVTLTYIRGERCADRLSVQKLAELKNEMPDLSSQSYIDALISISKGDEGKGQQLLKDIAAKGDAAGPFFIESQARLVDLAKSEKDLGSLREAWADSDSNAEGWTYVGRSLMDRYNQFKAWDQTIEVGFKMGESDPLDLPAARAFVVAAYRSGQTKMAMGYLQTYFGSSQDLAPSPDRLPANVDGFDEIVRDIRSDFDNGVVKRHPQRRPSAAMPTKLPAKKHRRSK